MFHDVGVFFVRGDAHAVEGALDEDQAGDGDGGAEGVFEAGLHVYRDLDGEEADEGEYDHCDYTTGAPALPSMK